jgi:hypothetical protein
LGQANLIVLGQEWVLANIGEIEPDKIFFVPLDTLFRQEVLQSDPSGEMPPPWLTTATRL